MRRLFGRAYDHPASALELGGASVSGDNNVGGNVSVDRDGASFGLGAGVGSVGEMDASGSVSTERGGASIGLSGSGIDGSSGVDGKGTGGTNASTGVAAADSSVKASTGSAGETAATSQTAEPTLKNRPVVPAARVPLSFALPRVLLPRGRGSDRSVATFEAIPGTPDTIVRACRTAIELAAGPYGAVDVRAKSFGSFRRLNGDLLSAPIQVRIKYQRRDGPEIIRQARIKCQLNAGGKVIKFT